MKPGDKTEGLEMSCRGIDQDGVFLLDHTGRGKDMSPEFGIRNVSPDAGSLCIVLEDVTHPVFGTMAHWLAWNVPVGEVLPSGIASGGFDPRTGIVQGVAYGVHRYRGPKPPRGRTHSYRFTLYVLDRTLDLSPRARLKRLLKTIRPFVLQSSELTGRFE